MDKKHFVGGEVRNKRNQLKRYFEAYQKKKQTKHLIENSERENKV